MMARSCGVMYQAEQEDAPERPKEESLTAGQRSALLRQLPSDTVAPATAAVEALNGTSAQVRSLQSFFMSAAKSSEPSSEVGIMPNYSFMSHCERRWLCACLCVTVLGHSWASFEMEKGAKMCRAGRLFTQNPAATNQSPMWLGQAYHEEIDI